MASRAVALALFTIDRLHCLRFRHVLAGRGSRVNMANYSDKVAFIWSVADLLRGAYALNQYRKVILLLTTLRGLGQVLDTSPARALEIRR